MQRGPIAGLARCFGIFCRYTTSGGRPSESRGNVGTTLHHPWSTEMVWAVLFAAGLFEIGWAVGLKYTVGFTRPWPTVATAVALIASLSLLGVALRTLPLGTAYAVWT